jgi:hypothetical protein
MSDETHATAGPLVHRSPKGDAARFARIDNAVLQDGRLSFRARGVLTYILSRPVNWRHNAEALAAASTEGVDAVRSALRELAAAGYARMSKARGQHGHIVHWWTFTETPPSPKNPETVTESGFSRDGPSRLLPGGGQPGSGQPGFGQPGFGQPPPGKTPRYETTDLETTDNCAPAAAAAKRETAKVPKPRRRNPELDALAAVDGSDLAQVTGSAWGRHAKALHEIRGVCPDVSADEIRRRAENYRTLHPTWTITATALAKHWGSLDSKSAAVPDPAATAPRKVSAA